MNCSLRRLPHPFFRVSAVSWASQPKGTVVAWCCGLCELRAELVRERHLWGSQSPTQGPAETNPDKNTQFLNELHAGNLTESAEWPPGVSRDCSVTAVRAPAPLITLPVVTEIQAYWLKLCANCNLISLPHVFFFFFSYFCWPFASDLTRTSGKRPAYKKVRPLQSSLSWSPPQASNSSPNWHVKLDLSKFTFQVSWIVSKMYMDINHVQRSHASLM